WRKKTIDTLLPKEGNSDADIAAGQIIEELTKFDIAAIGIAPMRSLLRNKNGRYGELIIGVTSLTELDQALADTDNLEGEALKQAIPEPYRGFAHVFSHQEASRLPDHGPYDHHIRTKEGFTPPYGPLYSLSKPEMVELRKFLDEYLGKRFIRASSSPAASPILFVKKPGSNALRLI